MKIHEKILKLKNIVPEKGATEAESLNALALAEKLMRENGITEKDLLDIEYKRDMKLMRDESLKKSEDPAHKLCGYMIGKFCNIILFMKYNKVEAFGFNQDVEMAMFLLDMLSKSMNRSYSDFLKSDKADSRVSKHILYWSFRHGFAKVINDKLKQMIDARTPERTSGGGDLMVIKDQIVKDGFNNQFPHMSFKEAGMSRQRLETNSFNSGKSYGDKVNLSRPINEKAGTKYLS